MTNVTFGEKVAAGLVAAIVVGSILLTALGQKLPEEIAILLPTAFAYILGSRTSEPKAS